MNILGVQDLCKTYGTGETEIHALNHVLFSVCKGGFIAVIGEAGSGKSTLLNVEQNITFSLLLGYKRPNQKFANELLQALELSERLQHLSRQFSGGAADRVFRMTDGVLKDLGVSPR